MAEPLQVDIRVVESSAPVDHDALRNAVKSVSLSQDVGMAAEVEIVLDVWNAEAGEYDLPAATARYHAYEFELWDMDADICLGRYVVESRDMSYGEDGPVLTVRAYDGLRQFMKGTQSRVYQGFKRDTDWLVDLAADYGMGLDADVADFQPFVGDRFKEVSKTDLDFIRTIAMVNGLAMPSIDYDHDFELEYLRMRSLNALTQGFGPLRLRVMPDGTGEGDLPSFSTEWDKGEVPTAVEVIGYDANTQKPYRVVVEATPGGPKTIIDEVRDISKSEAQQVTPGKAGGDSPGVIKHTLGEGRETADSGIFTPIVDSKGKKKRVRARREYREILSTTFAEGVESARAFAERWIATRLEGYYVCHGNLMPNVPDLGRIAVSQVHQVVNCLPDDEGWYILTSVTHEWGSDGHQVSFDGQRLLTTTGQIPADSAVIKTPTKKPAKKKAPAKSMFGGLF